MDTTEFGIAEIINSLCYNVKMRTVKGYYTLTEHQKSIIFNGIGQKGKWYNFLIPERIIFLDLTEVWNIHDFAYFRGKHLEDRMLADLDMLYNMLELIDDSTWILRYPRKQIAHIYYFMVDKHGHEAFFSNKPLERI